MLRPDPQGILSPAGVAALGRLARRRAMLMFDLDGTLAPIVARPDDARVPQHTAARLQMLGRTWPVAVITGRRSADAANRLGFKPRFLFGNHGAQGQGPRGARHTARIEHDLAPCRERLRDHAADLTSSGIDIEDKGLSFALHYRNAPSPQRAREHLDRLWAGFAMRSLRAEHGHFVLNITSTLAPDKGDALLSALRDCDASHALVVGDDLNDEPAFRKAPNGSVTVRIGAATVATEARFRLPLQCDLDRLLVLLSGLRP